MYNDHINVYHVHLKYLTGGKKNVIPTHKQNHVWKVTHKLYKHFGGTHLVFFFAPQPVSYFNIVGNVTRAILENTDIKFVESKPYSVLKLHVFRYL